MTREKPSLVIKPQIFDEELKIEKDMRSYYKNILDEAIDNFLNFKKIKKL